jgi:uncharacterized protein (DUF1697 family)
MTRRIGLLRGVNVGRGRKVEMARLRALMEELGYADVRTYVQSGNVVFSDPGGDDAARLEQHLAEQFTDAFGFAIPVILRTRDELADVLAGNPFAGVADDPARHVVLFLAAELDPGRLADLDPGAFAPEAFALRGRELHAWAPNGIGTSPLVKELSSPKRLGVESTARNWRTVEKLLALADGAG